MTRPITHALLQPEHGFFTREGGVSEGIYTGLNCGPGSGDTPAHIAENRRRVAAHFGQSLGQLCTLYQIHSPEVVTVTEPFTERPQADAMVTKTPGIVLGILTADCAPVLFADREAGVIGAAHAGWKGARYGVLENTIRAMEALGATRSTIAAVVGPCIAQQSYEVGSEFIVQFLTDDQQRFFAPSAKPGHFMFDLTGYVLETLRRANIHNTAAIGVDTYANEAQFFSYRRTTHRKEPDYGRQISAIHLR